MFRPRIRVGSNEVWHAGNLLNIGTTAASARAAIGIASFGGNLSALSISPRDFGVVDNTIATGLYRYSESDSDSGGPIASDRGAIMHTRRATGGGETQLYLSENTSRAFRRSRVTGAWSSWNEFGMLLSSQTWSGTNVFTGGYLVNRRVIPRVYLESPNQTNGYIVDANVSDSVFGSYRILRRDTLAEIFALNNAGQISSVNTITTTGAIDAPNMNSDNFLSRSSSAKWAFDARFSGTTAGGIWIDSGSRIRLVNAAFSAGIDLTSDLTTVYGHMALGDSKRASFRPDAVTDLTTDLPLSVVANLSANYHNNNLLGVHTTGIYFATDNQMTWQYKSGTTWRLGASLSPGATAGSGAFTIDGQINDISGNVRDMPVVTRNASANFTTADRGKTIAKTNTTAYSWTVTTTSGLAGQTVRIVNDTGTGDVTIVQGAGTVVIVGSTTGNYTLPVNTARTMQWITDTRVRIF